MKEQYRMLEKGRREAERNSLKDMTKAQLLEELIDLKIRDYGYYKSFVKYTNNHGIPINWAMWTEKMIEHFKKKWQVDISKHNVGKEER